MNYNPTSTRKIPRLQPIKVADVVVDPEEYSIVHKDKRISLRKKEFELLQFLITNKNQILNRNTILENVWGPHCNPFTNTVDVHVASLRKKLSAKNGVSLKTIHGVGYKLETLSIN